nr:hypothetical protein CFP56_70622 [Quercus suber]
MCHLPAIIRSPKLPPIAKSSEGWLKKNEKTISRFARRYCLSWTKNPQYTLWIRFGSNTPFPQVCRPC